MPENVRFTGNRLVGRTIPLGLQQPQPPILVSQSSVEDTSPGKWPDHQAIRDKGKGERGFQTLSHYQIRGFSRAKGWAAIMRVCARVN